MGQPRGAVARIDARHDAMTDAIDLTNFLVDSCEIAKARLDLVEPRMRSARGR